MINQTKSRCLHQTHFCNQKQRNQSKCSILMNSDKQLVQNSQSTQRNSTSLEDSLQILQNSKSRQKFTNLFLSNLSIQMETDKSNMNIKIRDIDNIQSMTSVIFYNKLDQIDKIRQSPYQNSKRPSVSSIKNLLILLENSKNYDLIKLQIKRQSIKQNIPFFKIYQIVCTQKLVSMFYKDHEKATKYNIKYIHKKIVQYLKYLIIALNIHNWLILIHSVYQSIKMIYYKGIGKNITKQQNNIESAYANQKPQIIKIDDQSIISYLRKHKKQIQQKRSISKLFNSYRKYRASKQNQDDFNNDQIPRGKKWINFRKMFPNIEFEQSGDQQIDNPQNFKSILTNRQKDIQNIFDQNHEIYKQKAFKIEIRKASFPKFHTIFQQNKNIEDYQQSQILRLQKKYKIYNKNQHKMLASKANNQRISIFKQIDQQFIKQTQNKMNILMRKWGLQNNYIFTADKVKQAEQIQKIINIDSFMQNKKTKLIQKSIMVDQPTNVREQQNKDQIDKDQMQQIYQKVYKIMNKTTNFSLNIIKSQIINLLNRKNIPKNKQACLMHNFINKFNTF